MLYIYTVICMLASKYHRILDYCCIFEDFLGAIFEDFCTDLETYYVHCMFTECIRIIYRTFYCMRQKKVVNIFTELYFLFFSICTIFQYFFNIVDPLNSWGDYCCMYLMYSYIFC
jgi:hypothetical protein